MKIIITGASGLLGRALMARFSALNPIGYAFSRADAKQLKKVDLTDPEQLSKALEADQPDIIIHAAAERRPDVCSNNPDAALKINIEATEQLAKIAKKLNAFVLYISTDYVFDGTQPPYHPNDPVNPINLYGELKLGAEKAIQNTLNRYGILRVGVLYGEVEYPEESAITTLVSLLDKKEAQVDDFCQRYPVHVEDVANACWRLAEIAHKDHQFKGLWHYCSTKPLTKYDMLLIMAKSLGRSTDHLIPVSKPIDDTPRPVDCALNCDSLIQLGVVPARAFSETIELLLKCDKLS